VNLLIGSASAKWALLAPIFVPMLMYLGISPELTQAAYRVGDSTTNIITPLMPYFPLVVVFSQKYVKSTGIGTLVSMMLPYSVVFMILWTAYSCSCTGRSAFRWGCRRRTVPVGSRKSCTTCRRTRRSGPSSGRTRRCTRP
jgi:hypothetical protein